MEKIMYKSRLVARGFTQSKGVDLFEIFSPMVKHTSIRSFLSLVVQYYFLLEHLDVKIISYMDILRRSYMWGNQKVLSYLDRDKECLHKKSLYNLKQASRHQYKNFDDHMLAIGFKRSIYDSFIYVKCLNQVSFNIFASLC